MRGLLLVVLFFVLATRVAYAQNAELNQLLKTLALAKEEEKLSAINELASFYYSRDSLSELRFYLDEAFKLIENDKELEDIHRTFLLKSNYLLSTGYLKESLPYSEKALRGSQKAGDNLLIIQSFKNLAEANARLYKTQLARLYIDSTLALAEEHNYVPGKTAALNILAFIEDNEGNKEKALQIFQELATIYEDKESVELCIVYNNMGELHRKMGNFEIAITYYFKSLHLSERLKDLSSIQRAFSNLGSAYLEMDSVDKSKEYYIKSSELARKLNDRYQSAVVIYNLASVEIAEGKYDKAEAYLDSSLQLCRAQNYLYGFVMNERRYGEIDVKRKQLSDALSHFRKAEYYADSLNLGIELVSIYEVMHDAYKQSGDYKNALKSLEQKYRLEDSLLLVEKNNIILDLQNRYEKEKKEREILILKQDLLIRENNTKVFYIVALLFLIAFASIIFIMILKRRKQSLAASLSSTENELLKKDLEHKNKELFEFALYIAETNQQSEQLAKRLAVIATGNNTALNTKIHQLHSRLTGNSPIQAWKDFEVRFDKVHSGFYDKLLILSPELTPNELRLCSLLHLNLSTKEIAEIMSRTVGTIDNARSAIRKKLKLDNDENLSSLLKSL